MVKQEAAQVKEGMAHEQKALKQGCTAWERGPPGGTPGAKSAFFCVSQRPVICGERLEKINRLLKVRKAFATVRWTFCTDDLVQARQKSAPYRISMNLANSTSGLISSSWLLK